MKRKRSSDYFANTDRQKAGENDRDECAKRAEDLFCRTAKRHFKEVSANPAAEKHKPVCIHDAVRQSEFVFRPNELKYPRWRYIESKNLIFPLFDFVRRLRLFLTGKKPNA